jgi:hypothetical protein
MFAEFYTQIQQRFFEAGWDGPWSWRTLEGFLFFLWELDSVEHFQSFLDSERPQAKDFHPQVFLYICKLVVFKTQILKCWSQKEEAAYLKMLGDYIFSD